MKPTYKSSFGVWCLILGLMSLFGGAPRALAEFEDIIREPQTELAIDTAMRENTPLVLIALQDAVAEVVTSTEDPLVRIAAADWYLSVIDKLGPALIEEDPEDALRDSWIVLRQMEAALDQSDAAESLGDARQILRRGSEDARSRIVGFARLNLSRDQFQRLRTLTIREEERRRAEDPGHQRFFEFGKRAESEEASSVVSELAAASSRTLRAVPGSEIAEGALRQTFGFLGGAARLPGMAVGTVADVGTGRMLEPVELMSVTLSEFPTDMRENLEKILANENYMVTLQSVDGLTLSIQGVSQAVERLPEEIRVTLDSFEASQPELRETIAETDVAIRNLELVLVQAELASKALESTMRAAGEAAEVAARFIPGEKDPSREHTEPFRMESVTEAAEASTITFAELHATLLSLHELVNDPQLSALASTAAAESKGFVDHVVFRLWLLLGGILVLLLLYHVARHFIAAWLARRNTAAPAAGG